MMSLETVGFELTRRLAFVVREGGGAKAGKYLGLNHGGLRISLEMENNGRLLLNVVRHLNKRELLTFTSLTDNFG